MEQRRHRPMINLKQIKLRYLFFYTALCLFFTLSLLLPVNLTNQDIGRHLTNGREVLNQHWQVLFTNYYSYTKPEKPLVNHHWLSGVIFYLVNQQFGFKGLHLFHIGIYTLTFAGLLALLKAKIQRDWLVVLLGLPAAVLLSSRAEIRPETFGHLFLIFSLWQLHLITNQKKIKTRQAAALLMLQVVWVNLHISFVFNLFLFGLAWLLSLLQIKPVKNINSKSWLKLTTALGLVSILNPNLINGLLQPLTIFTDYGYRIVENQNLIFLYRVIRSPKIFYWGIAAAVYLILVVRQAAAKRRFSFYTILAGLGLALGFIALRNIPVMVLFSFPYLATELGRLLSQSKLTVDQPLTAEIVSLTLAISLTAGFYLRPKFKRGLLQLGLLPGQNQAAHYLEQHPPENPIFNNYDLGSYLIYHLHPNYPVFVDNRPEAYGKEFFQGTYIPMQSNAKKWQQSLEQYQFQTIIIGVRDITPWNRAFLKRLVSDPDWKIEYQDQFCAIWKRADADSGSQM